MVFFFDRLYTVWQLIFTVAKKEEKKIKNVRLSGEYRLEKLGEKIVKQLSDLRVLETLCDRDAAMK